MRPFRQIALTLLVAGACADPFTTVDPPNVIGDPAQLQATVVSPATPGAVVDVRFTNLSATGFWFNPCSRLVERFTDGEWVRLPDELRICTADVYLIPAKGEVVRATDVPADARVGTYRFVFRLVPQDGSAESYEFGTDAFAVR